ncbi:putative RNA-binding la domain protein [Rosellinia necatrix]|uniref:Putative RNA-binding la domain protein n=1 Tax=Rosellinia necatrix TaxID=77044 RepID=A0A1S8A536_ROSNE|nr:putative RNA-binding la domain protein [Rosellinia necatrix]
MSDSETKPVEVADPVAVEASEDKSNESEAKAGDESTIEPTTEPTAGENGPKGGEAEGATADDGKPSIFRPPTGMLRVTGPRQQKKFVKSDPTSLEDTDNPHEIRKQVEFYFGDSNLPEDKFLWEKVGGEENKSIPVSLICNFSRMRRFKPYEAVVKALKASNFFVIEGPEGEETIRRKNAVDTDKRNKREERSVYVKGFGDETTSTQFDIEAFFAQYGQFDSVRLRRAEAPEKVFKGSVFVEWSDKETADKFIALQPEPQWKGHPLHIMWKLEYMKQKSEAIREGKISAGGRKFARGSHRGNRGHIRGSDRGGDKDDWKKRREQDQQNGFSDRRDNHRGRGRGRGRGNFRGRGGRDNNSRSQDAPVKPANDGRPKIHVSKEGAKIMEEEKTKSGDANGKRAREDDTSASEPPAKKVDTKEPATEIA